MRVRGVGVVGGGILGLFLGDTYRLTPGTLTVISLLAGFTTAVVVAYINTRSGRGQVAKDAGVATELEEYAAHRLSELEDERRELTERCNRQSMELARLTELLHLHGIDPSG